MTEGPLRRQGATRTWKERLALFGPAILITSVALVIAYQFVQPAPPRHIVLATGPGEGAYDYYGKIYRDRLQREGIEVTLRETRGSIENLELLKEGQADIAFVQGGTGANIDAPQLRSLASLYFEPVWVFVQKHAGIKRLGDLRGRRIAVDGEGSGTRTIALQLLADNGIKEKDFAPLPLGAGEAVQALRSAKADAAFFVIAARAPEIRDLLAAPQLSLLSIDRAPAYMLQHPFLSRLELPEGGSDLAANLPPRDTTLLAPAANLVVRNDFHPALSELLLRIAKEIHGERGIFEEAGQFPSRKYLEYPLSDQAKRYFDSGPSLLQRYLPFWAANLIDRLKIMLLPLITLVYPLLKFIPPTYDWRMRSRINRWYNELQAIEGGVDAQLPPEDLKRRLAELDQIEANVQRLSMPSSYGNPLYTLRSHIDLLRNELREALNRRAPQRPVEHGDYAAAQKSAS
jgi:TRAP transporter TAXI family solute receptor